MGGGEEEEGVWIKNEMSQSNQLGTLFLNCFKQTSCHLLELSKIVCLGPYELTMLLVKKNLCIQYIYIYISIVR